MSIPHIDAVASWPRQGGTPSGLRNSGWPGCGSHSRDDATTTVLAGRLSECVLREANVSEALVSFLNLDGKWGDDVRSPSCVIVANRTAQPSLTPMGISNEDTKVDTSDCQALTPGVTTALRRLHVNLGHPTNDDLTRCLAAGVGTRAARRAVKCMRCSACVKMSRLHSHRPSRIPTVGERFNERLFVDLCDLADVRGNRYSWLVAVDQHTDYTVICTGVPVMRVKQLPRKFSNIGVGGRDSLTYWCVTESEAWSF